MRNAHRQRGFTVLEASVVLAVFGGLLTLVARSFTATNGLVNDTQAEVRAQDEARRDLQAIADVLRGAAVTSLSGFDATSVATDLTFQRATGAVGGVATFDAAEEMTWQPATAPVNGVANPGQVVVTQGGVSRVLATRVAGGGFSVLQQGNTLVVRLSTYYSTAARVTKTLSTSTSISLRN
jgi:prepilin-type N-terminal cleavage/methylation domain-containing protein